MSFERDDWIRKAIRRLSSKWPPRYAAKVDRRIERGKYRCDKCKEIFRDKEIQIDHIEPVVAVTGFVDWNHYINRLFCEESGFQILCLSCHKEKTLAENETRRNNKKTIDKSEQK